MACPLGACLEMMHLIAMICFSCRKPIELRPGQRIGFRDECDNCGADLHVCRNCEFHDPSAYNECREPNAERELERERANRCEYFAAGSRASGVSSPQESAKARLDALFKK